MADIWQMTFQMHISEWICVDFYQNFTQVFVPKCQINYIPALVLIITWCRLADKPLSIPMMVSLLMHVCVLTQWNKQGKSEGFDSCDRPSNLKLDSNLQFFHPCDREIWLMTLQNNRAPLLCYFKLCASFGSHWWIQTWVTVRKCTPNLGQIRRFLEPCDLEIWRMTLQNNRAPLLCYFKLCASFCSHWWIQTWVKVRKRPIWVKFE